MATTTEERSPLPTQIEPHRPGPEPILSQLEQYQPHLEPRLECSLDPSPGPILNQDQTLSQTPFPSPSPSHRDREEEEDEDEEEGGNSGPGPEPVVGEHSDPEWVEERFRIDRKKLEAMLYAPRHGEGLTGEEFFGRVMVETNTQVKWPSKLKIGAKSKKDPHVKVDGKRANVLEAKKKILELLETKVNKVTLKMDVAHTEHSHVIGKGGGNIKKVMEMTSCHIHFPDSNRHNATGEKSNQVSIAGPVQGVEAARKRIRDLQPLVLTFDLPVTLVSQALPDAASPVIQQVAQALGVSVSFRAQPRLCSSCCVVRALQGNSVAIKKAVCVLMELLLGSELGAGGQGGVMGVVSTQLDVTSQQHLFLLGQNGAHFLGVMHQTQTQIVLPDLSAPQNPPSLLIQGSPDGVCLARQQLMDCLPVCLMFDMREDGEADPRKLAQMMQSLGVFISVKPKVKQTAKSVVVKGLERNISSLYEARRLLLGLESSEVAMTAKMNSDPRLAGNGLTNYWLNMLLQQLRLSDHGSVPTTEAVIGSFSQSKPHPSPPPGLTPPSEEVRMGLKGKESRQLEKIPENEDPSGLSDEDESPGSMTSELSDVMSQVRMMSRRSSLQGPEVCRFLNQGRRHSTGQVMRLLDGEKEGGRSERHNSLREMEGGRGDSRRNSLRELGGERSDTRRNSLMRDLTPNHDTLTDVSRNEDYDYEMKKLLATRAMQRNPVVTEVRTPTDTWSGLGFSKSMPAEAVKELRNVSRRSYKPYLANTGQQQQTWGPQNAKEKVSNGSNSENWRDRRGSSSPIFPSPSSSSSSSPSNFSSSFSSTSSFPAFASSTNRPRNDKTSESFLSCSNYFECMSSVRALTASQLSSSPQPTDDLPELLSQLGMGKYIDVFQQQEIDFQTFLTLSDEDLKEVGVSTFGARRKMLLAISDLNKSKRKLSETPAVKPGYLEGGASGRLPRIIGEDTAAQRNHW
ncbi:protein bicaudal C homolog 1-A-like isoform X1 [Oncorhynchus tshawytscha]|uniref:SAM domain-containing protein n=2 Tax=Oncorhynchus tshawytscha TaxID=74940 RepID=A0AAZ3S2Y5_ONCTS|nr:protein bicaudal C homolog 1-A-like isoform X1 [Oncorhynchus tshawytscha]